MFRSWFAKHGGLMHRNVRLDLSTDSTNAVRAVRFVTKGRVQKGQPIVTVPDALLVHVPESWPSSLAAEVGAFTDMELLCLYLLHLRQNREEKWKPYIDMLPATINDSAL